ncbi:MAG TPA: amidase family protein, partial [Caulobacteraceae bacterium]
VSPAELVEAAIARIEALNPALNAVTCKLYDRARAQAAGTMSSGPFAGVPFLIKDLISVAGVPNTSSCRALAGAVGQVSPPFVRAFETAGLIAVGLTNTPEFGLIDTTEPALHGPTHNPWDLSRSPAGSSGGSGAAVAAGLTPMAHASDGGGSIRLPACHNGVFGLKPSRGRGLATGFPAMPFGLPDIAVHGVLTRTVRDSAAMLSALEDPATPLGRIGAVRVPIDRKLRVALVREGTAGSRADPEVDAAILSVATLCESLGHPVEEVAWPFHGQAVMEAFIAEWQVLAAGAVAQTCAAVGCAANAEHFEPWTLELARRGAALSPDRIAEVVRTLGQAASALEAFFGRWDVLLSPVLSHPPKKLGEHATDLPYDVLFERVAANAAYTPVFNVSGSPAMSVPLNWTASGLPIGAQFAGPVGAEGRLLGLAYQLEAARPWADRWPPTSVVAMAAT